ncbi:hypothetical protein ACFQ6C_25985 [Streptomyces sp. NPDC056454]|uniref:hypothetical protein n=1 Tax=Streptomyces sp. NPDC056454 TaxID=3345823 RepID=UPI0036BFBF3E
MPYNRGYKVEHRGVFSHWTCLREGCDAKGNKRGEEHEEKASFIAARHQQEQHHDELIRDAAEALRGASEALATLTNTLTYVDTTNYTGSACMKPMDVTEALKIWSWQMESLLPEADPGDWRRRAAKEAMCRHETRNHTPSSWMVLMGLAEVGTRANPEVPRGIR